jgi:predicted regulator of Ras-like GTPase activity (Roadblock/LC7/MglB family)
MTHLDAAVEAALVAAAKAIAPHMAAGAVKCVTVELRDGQVLAYGFTRRADQVRFTVEVGGA